MRLRTVTTEQEQTIKSLFAKLKNKAEVARIVKMNQCTVRHYLQEKPKEESKRFFSWKQYNNSIY